MVNYAGLKKVPWNKRRRLLLINTNTQRRITNRRPPKNNRLLPFLVLKNCFVYYWNRVIKYSNWSKYLSPPSSTTSQNIKIQHIIDSIPPNATEPKLASTKSYEGFYRPTNQEEFTDLEQPCCIYKLKQQQVDKNNNNHKDSRIIHLYQGKVLVAIPQGYSSVHIVI